MDIINVSKFRTKHSICDVEVARVLRAIPDDVKLFIDYGCHLGHLSFEVAMRHEAHVMAVDNFTGTIGDHGMAETFKGSPNGFRDQFDRNLAEVQSHLIGKVEAIQAEDFWKLNLTGTADAIFVDASHRAEDAHEFEALGNIVKPGGILMGHDYGPGFEKGVKTPVDALAKSDKFTDFRAKGYIFFMTKRDV